MGEVVERLRIDAEHVIFGHTHRRGPMPGEDEWRRDDGGPSLWNAGSWVHSPSLLRSSARNSPYWPGTVAFVDDDGPPRLEHLLDELDAREDLAQRLSSPTACASDPVIAAPACSIAFGLPGKLTIRVRLRVPAIPRERNQCSGTCSREARRIASAKPGASRSITSRVASGVTSSGERPVPPVVAIRSQPSSSA